MVYEKVELLPCPFCGKIPRLQQSYESLGKTSWDIFCGTMGCYLEFGAEWYNTKEDAVKMWNTRKYVE